MKGHQMLPGCCAGPAARPMQGSPGAATGALPPAVLPTKGAPSQAPQLVFARKHEAPFPSYVTSWFSRENPAAGECEQRAHTAACWAVSRRPAHHGAPHVVFLIIPNDMRLAFPGVTRCLQRCLSEPKTPLPSFQWQ